MELQSAEFTDYLFVHWLLDSSVKSHTKLDKDDAFGLMYFGYVDLCTGYFYGENFKF